MDSLCFALDFSSSAKKEVVPSSLKEMPIFVMSLFSPALVKPNSLLIWSDMRRAPCMRFKYSFSYFSLEAIFSSSLLEKRTETSFVPRERISFASSPLLKSATMKSMSPYVFLSFSKSACAFLESFACPVLSAAAASAFLLPVFPAFFACAEL